MAHNLMRFLLLALILACLDATTVDLPGVGVLRAGYDAASWIRRGGDSKYRIFDLDEAGHQVQIPSINKVYTAPAIASVVTDGPQCERIEDSCEGIATSFESYLKTHSASTEFDVGFSTRNFNLGLEYHKEIQEIYEAITKLGQAVSVSESWWGMYQITLPPPFLLVNNFDPMFQRAKAALLKIGVPKLQEEQEIYNQMCCGPSSFGTHYIGSVIVGARAIITSFVNSSFDQKYSKTTVEEQISIGFQWEKLKAMGSQNAAAFEEKLLQDFKNSSHTRFEWQPDYPDIHGAATPWLAWQDAATKFPVVVNMSVSSLAKLFFDEPQIMDHMQKSIDFYILNSRAPTLKDLNGGVPITDGATSNSATVPAPGLGVVGCGFHAPSLTSRMCLFEVSKEGSIWSNPYYPNISYTVPEGFMITDTPESTLLRGSIVVQSVDDYIERSYWKEHHHSDGVLGFGSKSEDKTTEKYYRNFYAHRYFLALSMRQISWYTLQMMELPMPRFSSMFQAALDVLPQSYEATNKTSTAMFEQFFEAFGTSVISKADMGGMVWAESWFESCLSHMYSDTCITDEVTHGWWIFHDHHEDHTCSKRITEDFAKYSSRHYETLGGTAEVNISKWDEWALTVKNDPRPVTFEVLPIHYLLPDASPVKQALVDATSVFLKMSATESQRDVDALKKLRPPPSSICKRSASHQGMSEEVKIDPLLQHVLCPIVGYHGAYCPLPVDTGLFPEQGSDNSNPVNLPRGIGLTIDVATGDLKLPAWDFDFSGVTKTWTEPASQNVFRIPRGLSLSTDIAAENVAVTHIFKTEDELASVWEEGYARGSWLGGEFGNSKSVSDLYSKFFSHQQSTTISQHPTALYRLVLESGWESHLNSFALEALRALPDNYDADVYSHFLDTWGTHIANDTLVGGMAEQQVTMKDCVFQDPYLSGGLSDEQLLRYLQMDLTNAAPNDPFYTSRRQISLNHRVGGNPELTDQTSWVTSLAQDPALLKIFSYVEWARVASSAKVTSTAVVTNLAKAVSERLATANQKRTADKEATAKLRVAELQGPRPVVAVVAHGRRGTISPEEQTGQSLTLKSFASCPEGLDDQMSASQCSTGVNSHSWNAHELVSPLRYERNAQGQMRSKRCFDLDPAGKCIDHIGPWVSKGCSAQPMANGQPRNIHEPVPDRTVIGAVCADCELISSGFPQDATLKCVCPGYTTSGDETLYNTFTGRMPNYKQCDPRWKCFPYAGQPGLSTCNTTMCHEGGPQFQLNNICGSGCGIASAAMLLSYYRRAVEPPDVAKHLIQKGFRNDLQNITGATCDGISHMAICNAATHWGLSCAESRNFSDLDSWLDHGPVIAHVRHWPWTKLTACKFTKAGHYIVITSKVDGHYKVSDPNSHQSANSHATKLELSVQCKLVGFVRIFAKAAERMIFA